MDKRRALIWTTVGGIVMLFFGWLLIRNIGLPEGRPLTTLSPQGDKSQNIQNLIIPVFAIAGLVFLIVEVGLIYLVTRFRRSKDDRDGVEEPEQVHGDTRLEIGWTIVPAVVLAVLAVFNVQTILAMDDANRPARDHGHRPAVVVGVPLRHRQRRCRRHHHRHRGSDPGGSRHRVQDPVERRDPLLLDPGARTARWTRSRAARTSWS